VRADDWATRRNDVRRLEALLNVLSVIDHSRDSTVEGDGRGAWRPREALLEASRGYVDMPGIHFEGISAERSRAVNVKQHVVLATQRSDLGKRLQHGGGRVAMADGDHLGSMLLDGRLDDVSGQHFAPFALDFHHLGSQSP